MNPILQAGQILKDLETNICRSSYDRQWEGMRDDFISTIDQVTDITDVDVLLNQLRHLEDHVKECKKNDIWNQWKRQYWMLITDPDINVTQSVTRFMIAWKLLEENLLPKAYYKTWRKIKLEEVLKVCDDLVDPLTKLSFYHEMFLNVDTVLKQFGYETLEEYSTAVDEGISIINSIAEDLDSVTKKTGIADTTAGGLGITSGVACISGLVLAPFTAGLSLGLTIGGVALGVGSAVTSLTSSSIQYKIDKTKEKEVENTIKLITVVTLSLTELLQSYATSANEVITDIDSELLENYATSADELNTEIDSVGKLRTLKYLKDAGSNSITVCKGIDRMITVIRQIKPNLMAEGLGAKALVAAAPGFKIPEISKGIPGIIFSEAKTLGSTAAKISSVFAIVSIGFGISETISGAKKIKNKSVLSKNFRELAKNLASAKTTIVLAYNNA